MNINLTLFAQAAMFAVMARRSADRWRSHSSPKLGNSTASSRPHSGSSAACVHPRGQSSASSARSVNDFRMRISADRERRPHARDDCDPMSGTAQ